MLTVPEIVRSVYGAWRLARFDPIGMEWLDRTTDGFWRSFRVAILMVPLEVAVLAIALGNLGPLEPLPRIAAVAGISYIISWTAFPVLVHPLVTALNRAARYPGYIVAINWSNVVIYAVLVPLALLADSMPAGAGALLNLVLYGAIGIYHWFITRTALDVGPGPAAGLTMMELVISFTNSQIALSMMIAGMPV